MNLKKLTDLMVEHGLVIRAIPFERTFVVEAQHKDKYPQGIEYYDEARKRPMLKVTEKNSQGGKFIITSEKTQGKTINYWGKPSEVFTGAPVVFYDSIERAVAAIVDDLEGLK